MPELVWTSCPIHGNEIAKALEEPGCSCVPQVLRDIKARADASTRTDVDDRIRELEAEAKQKMQEGSALVRVVQAAGKLFERMACEDHRHPPDDHVSSETWAAVAEWQSRPEVQAAMMAGEIEDAIRGATEAPS